MPELLDDDELLELELLELELLELELLELELLELVLDDPLLLPVVPPQPDTRKPAAATKARLTGDINFEDLYSNCIFINPAGVLF